MTGENKKTDLLPRRCLVAAIERGQRDPVRSCSSTRSVKSLKDALSSQHSTRRDRAVL